MTTTVHPPTTAAEFLALPDSGARRALVYGEIIETMLPGGLHGIIVTIVSTLLQVWAKNGSHGIVGVESDFILHRDPDTVRGPDVFFVRAERIPKTGIPEAF